MEARDYEVRLAKSEWRLEALDRWRDRVEARMVELENRTAALARADEIATAVAQKVNGTRSLQLSWLQKAGALVAGALFLAAQVKGLI